MQRVKLILILFIGFGFYVSKSQNLIINSGFENYTNPVNCSGGGGGFDNYTVFPVTHVVNNWYTYNSPDYFSELCSGVNNNGSPLNIFGYSLPKEGNNYAGFILFQAQGDTKEYIYQKLQSPLQTGKVYCLSFWVSRADNITHSIHSIGAYFSNNALGFNGICFNLMPQVVNQVGFITDTIGWEQIQGCFIANGGEQYITIGNFNNNTNTDTLYIGSTNQLSGADRYAYYYIDDISLVEDNSTNISEQSSLSEVVSVWPNPAKDVLNISISNELLNERKTEIKIYNTIGELVLSESLTAQNLSLETYNLQSGVYFYRILVGDNVIKTDKIVIIK